MIYIIINTILETIDLPYLDLIFYQNKQDQLLKVQQNQVYILPFLIQVLLIYMDILMLNYFFHMDHLVIKIIEIIILINYKYRLCLPLILNRKYKDSSMLSSSIQFDSISISFVNDNDIPL